MDLRGLLLRGGVGERKEGERKRGMGRGLIGLDPVFPTFFCESIRP